MRINKYLPLISIIIVIMILSFTTCEYTEDYISSITIYNETNYKIHVQLAYSRKDYDKDLDWGLSDASSDTTDDENEVIVSTELVRRDLYANPGGKIEYDIKWATTRNTSAEDSGVNLGVVAKQNEEPYNTFISREYFLLESEELILYVKDY